MVEGESILLGTEPDANGVPWALLAVSTFKVASWGPIALKGGPPGVADWLPMHSMPSRACVRVWVAEREAAIDPGLAGKLETVISNEARMELGTLPDWVSAAANVAVAGAAIVAAWQGIKGLSAWRSEAFGRRRMELAEELLAGFYEARDILQWVRFPASNEHEAEDRRAEEGEDETIHRYRDTFYVPIARLTNGAELFSRLRAHRYRAIATFGPGAAGPFDELNLVRAQITSAASTLIRLGPDYTGERRRYEAIVWEGIAEPDELKARIDRIVSDAEDRFGKDARHA